MGAKARACINGFYVKFKDDGLMEAFSHRSRSDGLKKGISIECSDFNTKGGDFPSYEISSSQASRSKNKLSPEQISREVTAAVFSSPFDAMGGIQSTSEVEGDVDADAPDALGLTARNKAIIRNSFKLLQPNLKGHGHAFFCHLFDTYPEYQDLFVAVRGVPPEELKTSKKLAAHGLLFMTAVDAVVANMEEQEILEELMRKMAARHNPFGLTKADYKKATRLFVDFFLSMPEVEKLDVKKDILLESWQKLFDVAVDVIAKYIEPKN
ncbi:unnamed protein product [Darwinula stevensoni]|uniref:Globin domain-containing protein n=1 Tax=Darwinula stevensoni TaxID=69355 RepID=A0A7R9A4S6_9CRUS|nr:unnamed protein product [Darwinula stevensoni]CAG0894154.1 unnamed protein product [Darwinula stevensoni]